MTIVSMREAPAIRLMGVRLHAMTAGQVLDTIGDRIRHGKGGWVVTPNLDIARQAQRDAWLRGVIDHADLSLADGMPLVWASRLRGTPLPQRVAGSSLVLDLAERAAERGWRLYLLGGAPGAAEAAAQVLTERFPGLVICGIDCPPMGFDQDESQVQAIRERLLASGADLVYVALGCPKQERLIERVREALPAAWWLGVGISLSFIAGDVARAPRWVQAIGMEWVHRLLQEPGRLAKRYLLHGLPFAFRLWGHALAQRGWGAARRVWPVVEKPGGRADP